VNDSSPAKIVQVKSFKASTKPLPSLQQTAETNA
jgi:hypothetical protein